MSNPLLNPNDPRFKKPQLGGKGNANPFAEQDRPLQTTPAAEKSELYAASSDDPRPYAPQYTAQQHPRYRLLLILGSLGWAASIIGAVSMTGILDVGWMAPMLGAGPAAAAWLLAYEDLKAIRLGAIAAAAQPPTRHAFWLGLTGLLACLGVVAGMIAQQMHALPDL